MAEYILSSLRSTAGVIRCQMDEASGDDVNLWTYTIFLTLFSLLLVILLFMNTFLLSHVMYMIKDQVPSHTRWTVDYNTEIK